ncbi:hypothetical protein ACFX5U_20205 [Sphingobacterium sp. SG20118]|uniref:hypothetical protein n=1 Tax=Sphingobacterium sp. SG20118 TaxID=3367156 RepID=UPI0037DFC1B3
MKNKLTLAILVLVAICIGQQAKAQTASTTPVNLSIELQDAISITLGGTPEVEFVYANAADYAGSQTITKPAHFTVVSNQKYNITVNAVSAFTPSLDLDVVQISVASTTAPSIYGTGTLNTAVLSTTAASLVDNAIASKGATYDIDYKIPDATKLLGLTAGEYTTTVVYTATQL